VAASFKAEPGVGTILTMSGLDAEKVRAKVTDQFRNQDNLILISTDSAAEGVNLHQRCHHLIHLELPFNPNRLEQRNGRIDRYGQTHNPAVRYLYLRGTFEDRILLRLIAKYEKMRARGPSSLILSESLPPPTRLRNDSSRASWTTTPSFSRRRATSSTCSERKRPPQI
jgi:superfamily II DNA/RNA helicase